MTTMSVVGVAQGEQEVFAGDERAAGVISGADPYRELELYLEKVNVSLRYLVP